MNGVSGTRSMRHALQPESSFSWVVFFFFFVCILAFGRSPDTPHAHPQHRLPIPRMLKNFRVQHYDKESHSQTFFDTQSSQSDVISRYVPSIPGSDPSQRNNNGPGGK